MARIPAAGFGQNPGRAAAPSPSALYVLSPSRRPPPPPVGIGARAPSVDLVSQTVRGVATPVRFRVSRAPLGVAFRRAGHAGYLIWDSGFWDGDFFALFHGKKRRWQYSSFQYSIRGGPFTFCVCACFTTTSSPVQYSSTRDRLSQRAFTYKRHVIFAASVDVDVDGDGERENWRVVRPSRAAPRTGCTALVLVSGSPSSPPPHRLSRREVRLHAHCHGVCCLLTVHVAQLRDCQRLALTFSSSLRYTVFTHIGIGQLFQTCCCR